MDSYKTIAEDAGRFFIDMHAAAKAFPGLPALPVSLRILIENLLRAEDGISVRAEDIAAVARRNPGDSNEIEIAFRPTRVVMQDYAGMPTLIDLAGLRDKAARQGIDPGRINPRIPSDLVVDHSAMVYSARQPEAFADNLCREFANNAERFAFLKWAQSAFSGLRVVPPGQGIIHQINIEYLAEVVSERAVGEATWLFPDTVIGTDSHTTMVNGLGVLGWGVGGIEAEAVMLGEPVSMLVPPVIGVRLSGEVPTGILATDIALTLTEALRKRGVVGNILEFFGPGVPALPVADRVTISNMTPEFGATAAFFPCDDRTLDYLYLTGLEPAHVERVSRYLKRNGMWFDAAFRPTVADVLEFDLSSVCRSISGPRRPQERHDLAHIPAVMRRAFGEGQWQVDDLKDGDIVIAAITSCTNTSNPAAMIAAGLLARNARNRGLEVSPRIKTSLAPGSRVVIDYLTRAGLTKPLSELGFDLVAFGCTTCVGNTGELATEISSAIDEGNLTVAAVLSGNRNFEGRIHGQVKANFLASPPLVVAYALAGSVLRDLTREPLGHDPAGEPVFLADIWPDDDEIQRVVAETVSDEQFMARYATVLSGGEQWDALEGAKGAVFNWSEDSTYLMCPPFFDLEPFFVLGRPMLKDARPLLILGDSVTTDHISPVGAIASGTPAAEFLGQCGVAQCDFNAYGARRGNHEVMVRGTFANVRLCNTMVDKAGGYTRIMPDGTPATVYDASRAYIERGTDTIVIAGKMYGAGSARDWAAKGTRLLGIKAVVAESFERIHRSNLVRLGVLPLAFDPEVTCEGLGIEAGDTFTLQHDVADLKPLQPLVLRRRRADGRADEIPVIARVDTLDELRYLRDGGIQPSVAKRFLAAE